MAKRLQRLKTLARQLHRYFPTLGFVGVIIAVLSTGGIITGIPTLANPLDGNIQVQGTVQANPPSQPAVITSPTQGQQFSQTPITVKGTCTGNTIVEIYKNNVFAGSGACDSNGTFSIVIDLFIGNNTLIAKIKDSLGQYGPDSAPVQVTYKPAAPKPSGPTGGGSGDGPAINSETQLVLLIDADYRGSFPGDILTIQPSILGGQAPYAIKIEWGDGTEDIIARKSNGPFDASHVYNSPGTWTIKISASDNNGQKAFIQTVAIVNGPVEATDQPSKIDSLLSPFAWWLWLLLFILLILIGIIIGIAITRHRHRKAQEKARSLPPIQN